MVSIERTREILADATLSDQEIESIRDNFRDLAEIILNNIRNNNENYGKRQNDLQKDLGL